MFTDVMRKLNESMPKMRVNVEGRKLVRVIGKHVHV